MFQVLYTFNQSNLILQRATIMLYILKTEIRLFTKDLIPNRSRVQIQVHVTHKKKKKVIHYCCLSGNLNAESIRTKSRTVTQKLS